MTEARKQEIRTNIALKMVAWRFAQLSKRMSELREKQAKVTNSAASP